MSWNKGNGRLRGAPARFGAENVLRGLAAARTGRIVSLNAELADSHVPFGRAPFRRTMRLHNQVRPLQDGGYVVINDDEVSFALQGSSQWDSFAHFGHITPGDSGAYFGGVGLDETYPSMTTETLGIQALGPGIVCRAVLLDVVGTVGPDTGFLGGDVMIDRALVEETLQRQDVSVEPGDAVLLYTGFERHRASLGGAFPARTAGLIGDTVELWRELDILALASDNPAVERTPADYSVHIGVLRDMGVPMGELWALGALADICREEERYDFCLASVPLAIHGAFGSTANAVAIL